MYALGLPFYGLYKILVPTFYALDRQKIPVMASLVSIAFNIVFCLVLTPVFGFKVLAFGTTLSVFLNAVIQSLFLKRDLSLSWRFFFSARMAKIVGATLGAAVVVEALLKVEFYAQPFFNKCFYLGAQILSVGALYVTFLMLLGERSAIIALLDKVTKKLRRSK
jgi:putative peptidoglycan lipid II flippase